MKPAYETHDAGQVLAAAFQIRQWMTERFWFDLARRRYDKALARNLPALKQCAITEDWGTGSWR